MNYVITGAAGKVSKPLAKKLLQEGHNVTVVGRSEKNIQSLIDAGARAAIGAVEDADFVTKAFAGADAVYTMCPTDIFVDDLKVHNELVGRNYAAAISANEIRYVVNLSGIGAHLTQGAGPLSAIHYTEQALKSLENVHIRTLRSVYFYHNLLAMVDMVRHMGIIGSNFSFATGKFPVAHADDVAAVAAEELLQLNFSGHSMRYVASDETSTGEIAAVLGYAIGKPNLQWVKFLPEQVAESLQQMGFPAHIAKEYADMFGAMDRGLVTEDYWKNRPAQLGNIKLPDFAKQFADIYYKKPIMITQ